MRLGIPVAVLRVTSTFVVFAILFAARWVKEFLRFHRDRTGRWIHPQEMGEPEEEAFLTHLAVNRRVAESTQNQALGAPPCASSVSNLSMTYSKFRSKTITLGSEGLTGLLGELVEQRG